MYMFVLLKSNNCNAFIFQPANEPKPTANAVKYYFERKTYEKTLTVMKWPPHSPALNSSSCTWCQGQVKYLNSHPSITTHIHIRLVAVPNFLVSIHCWSFNHCIWYCHDIEEKSYFNKNNNQKYLLYSFTVCACLH